jgi:hypothetical protein
MCRKLFVLLLVLTFVTSASAALKGNWTLDDNAANNTVAAKVGTDGGLYESGVGPLNTNTVQAAPDKKEGTGSFHLSRLGSGAGGTGSEYIEVSNSDNALTPHGAYTVAFWIKVHDWSTHGTAYGGVLRSDATSTILWPEPGEPSVPYWYYTRNTVGTNNRLRFLAVAGVGDYLNTAYLTTGAWHHIAFTHNGNDIGKAYTDGALSYTRTNMDGAMARLDMINGAGTLFIGRHATVDRGMNQQYDDYAIWNQELTQSQVEQVMYLGAYSIPEPTTIALLGLGGLALIRRKR